MSEKIVSPGVFTKEIDQSFIPAALGDIGAAIVGPTVKGPVLQPTVVSSYGEYVQIFGELIESGSDKYQYLTSHTAQEYLRQGGPLTVLRVADADATKAFSDIPTDQNSTVTNFTASFNVHNIPSGSAVGDSNDEFKIGSVDFTAVSSSIGLANTANQFFFSFAKPRSGATPTDGTHIAAQNLAEAIASASGSLNIVSASSKGALLEITASAAYNVTTASAYKWIDCSPAGQGGWNVAGGVKAYGDPLFTLEALGDGTQFNNNSSSIGDDSLVLPLTSSAGNDQFNDGSYGGRSDNFKWEVSNRNLKKGTFTLLIRAGNDTIKQKQILETHSNISLDPESNDYILKRIGNTTNTIAVEDGVAFLQPDGEYPNRSKFVRVKTLPETSKTDNYLSTNGTVNAKYSDSSSFFPAVGSGSYHGTFGGGTFGSEIVHPFNFYLSTEADIATNTQGVKLDGGSVGSDKAVGTSTVGGGYMTALSMLSNKDEYNFNLLFLPGIIDQETNHGAIITKAIDICETRGDAFLVYDNTRKTSNVATAKSRTESRNSSYSATYYPWVQIQDNTLGTYRFVPPSVVISGVYHFNDVVGQPWFAPAGLNRGGIDSAIQAYRKLTQGNRDDLYDSNVNPIATFPGQGVTVFGQKTTQKKASALDRVNVRRLLINVKSFISRSSRLLVFEQNTTDLRDQFLNTVNPFLEQVQANSGINAFRVVMDDTNNTPETIDRNELIGQVFLQPTRTAEFIILDFIVQPTGAAFPE